MNKRDGLLGIMVTSPNKRRPVLASYLRDHARMSIFCFTPGDIDWERKRIRGLYRTSGKWAVRSFPFPEVVYNRCYESDQSLIDRLEAVIGKNKCFNHINRLNKLEIHHHLNRWLTPYLPETVPFNEHSVAELLAAHRLIYLKPCYGNMGRGVYRVELKDNGEISIGDHHLAPKFIVSTMAHFQEKLQELLGPTPYIVQQGVRVKELTGRVFDIRVLAQKNVKGDWSVTSVISRVAFKGRFNTSVFEKMVLSKNALHYLFSRKEAAAMMTTIYDISLRAAEIIELDSGLHLGEMSVDLAVDDESRLWIIEVNGKPQKSLYKGFRSNRAAYRRPLEYAAFLKNR